MAFQNKCQIPNVLIAAALEENPELNPTTAIETSTPIPKFRAPRISSPKPQTPINRKKSKQSKQVEKPATPAPTRPRLPFGSSSDESQFLKDIRRDLNKITPEKFEEISNNLIQSFQQITDDKSFKTAVDIVATKSASEPNFSSMYALLCVKLNDACISPNEKERPFRRQLLTWCQKEFETHDETDAKDNLDDEEKEYLELKEKKKKIGNIQFVGEIFKSKLLPETIVHRVIQTLLNDIIKHKDDKKKFELYGELLNKLLTTVGSIIDHPEAKKLMDAYFSKISEMASDMANPSRIRFMFQELIELRKKRWVDPKAVKAPEESRKQIGRANSQLMDENNSPVPHQTFSDRPKRFLATSRA
jgi:translation initiation factor 4G